MNKIIDKYLNDTIQKDELGSLKDSVNSMDDNDLSSYIREEWDKFGHTDLAGDKESKAVLARIKTDINKVIQIEQPKEISRYYLSIYKKVANIAAILLLPILLYSTYHFYSKSQILETNNMIVSTGKDEFANITLPDGTKVELSSESELSYAPHLYNKEDRFINFEGEAYFDVQKDIERRFIVETKDSRVVVLGTKFNIRARASHKSVSLFLEEGKVDFISILTGKSNIITPNHRANLIKNTGEVTIRDLNDATTVVWRARHVLFINAQFSNIASTINDIYNIEVVNNPTIKTFGDNFTGRLPSNDLEEALKILEYTYKVKAINKDGKISFTNR